MDLIWDGYYNTNYKCNNNVMVIVDDEVHHQLEKYSTINENIIDISTSVNISNCVEYLNNKGKSEFFLLKLTITIHK